MAGVSLAEQTRAATAGVIGALRPVVAAPDAVLSQPGKAVDPASTEIVQLVADLLVTMRSSPGCVGLAAPQVGLGLRVFVVDVTGHPKAANCQGPFALCNAEVAAASRWRPGREGCMSVPELTGDVKRATRVTVTGQLPGTGEQVSVVSDAFEARALQHEIDHCNGLLFLDRVAGAHAVHPRKVYL
ncbi:peptide deformylase [Natronosporangium hydrolyticum]|uniref:Peptide deformylase n=1 Tax=Natronosporangium hydrolyticum TaxID=2811111 RepID=A0A895YSP6_9ACTN|nr:peptide deformylase [Natronosporangium hydrolyticum]QSB17048.1 peptide deformylase [Natronosporangium hydrolyticum]